MKHKELKSLFAILRALYTLNKKAKHHRDMSRRWKNPINMMEENILDRIWRAEEDSYILKKEVIQKLEKKGLLTLKGRHKLFESSYNDEWMTADFYTSDIFPIYSFHTNLYWEDVEGVEDVEDIEIGEISKDINKPAYGFQYAVKKLKDYLNN